MRTHCWIDIAHLMIDRRSNSIRNVMGGGRLDHEVRGGVWLHIIMSDIHSTFYHGIQIESHLSMILLPCSREGGYTEILIWMDNFIFVLIQYGYLLLSFLISECLSIHLKITTHFKYTTCIY